MYYSKYDLKGKPYYGHLRVFRRKALAHIPKYERAKLYVELKDCIYHVPLRDKLGFRLWNPTKRMVV